MIQGIQRYPWLLTSQHVSPWQPRCFPGRRRHTAAGEQTIALHLGKVRSGGSTRMAQSGSGRWTTPTFSRKQLSKPTPFFTLRAPIIRSPLLSLVTALEHTGNTLIRTTGSTIVANHADGDYAARSRQPGRHCRAPPTWGRFSSDS